MIHSEAQDLLGFGRMIYTAEYLQYGDCRVGDALMTHR